MLYLLIIVRKLFLLKLIGKKYTYITYLNFILNTFRNGLVINIQCIIGAFCTCIRSGKFDFRIPYFNLLYPLLFFVFVKLLTLYIYIYICVCVCVCVCVFIRKRQYSFNIRMTIYIYVNERLREILSDIITNKHVILCH